MHGSHLSDPCLCRALHIDCNPSTCPQSEHAVQEYATEPLKAFRKSAARGCGTCAAVVAALSIPSIKDEWKGTIIPAWESDRNQSFTAGLLDDDEEIPIEIDPPSLVNGRHVIRTKTTQESFDWRNFNLFTDSSRVRTPKTSCLAFRPLRCSPVEHTNSIDSLNQLKTWIEDCNRTHQCYTEDNITLPKRLIKISENQVKIVEPSPRPVSYRYTTLSHRWSKAEHLMLTTWTRKNLSRDIPWDTIPRLYQDAILLTRQLGVEYLWIDTLCIIQDDPDDWATESIQMGSIYGKSYLNIAASCASESDESLFSSSDFPDQYPIHSVPGTDGVYVRQQPFWTHNDFGSNYAINEDSPVLLQRGWVLQERLLAPRVVYYDAEELKWECTEAVDCQCGAIVTLTTFKPAYYKSLESADIPLPFQWMRIVERYSELTLTFDEDRLVALAGIASQAGASGLGGRYLAGSWEQDLAHQLCWRILDTHRRPKMSMVPSWSWLSVFGNVMYVNRMDYEKTASLIDVDIIEADWNYPDSKDLVAGMQRGFLRLNGRGVEMCAALLDFGSETEPPTYSLKHKSTGETLEGGFPMDYSMPANSAKGITEAFILFWGDIWCSEHAFMILRKVPGKDKAYERIVIFWWSKDEAPDKVDRLLGWCKPVNNLVIV